VAILLGLVPPGGTGTLPGIALCALGVIDLLILPRQIAKLRSGEIGQGKVIVTAASFVVFAAVGLMLYFGKI
jgi:hypothetical protein